MAGCYHDKEDVKSDLDIEVAREGDILEDGQDLDEMECEKNPGHRDFIPFKDLTLDHLPKAVRYKETLDGIKTMGSIVVRIVRDGLVGSGYVGRIENARRDRIFCIITNNHVVNTDDDVRRCTVEFNYDSKDRSSVVTCKGVKLVDTCPYRDITAFEFSPIPDFLHQLDWNRYDSPIPSIVIMYKDGQIVVDKFNLMLYPSLFHISYHNLNNPLIDVMFLSWINGDISYIKSPYFKFKPMSADIKALPSIDVHIDNGKSRVIPGDVVKFGDEFVVKISESIFQDMVKKCRLVWNGEVIGIGTRLYFQQIEPSKVTSSLCGVDSETCLQMWSRKDFFCVFDCKKPKHIEDRLNSSVFDMCCIGHPHGSIKMVTFGLSMTHVHERFDNQGRHIEQPGKHCQCKIVRCHVYSCPTCKGSSGSPVFVLVKKPELKIHLTHFMGQRWEALLKIGERVENISLAWNPTGSVKRNFLSDRMFDNKCVIILLRFVIPIILLYVLLLLFVSGITENGSFSALTNLYNVCLNRK